MCVQYINLHCCAVPNGAISTRISVTGTPTAGEMYSLMCTVEEEILGLTGEPVVVWMDSNGNVMEGNDITVMSSNGMSTVTFNPLRLTNADTYTCTGSLQSPALSTPLTVTQQQRVEVTRELVVPSVLAPLVLLYLAFMNPFVCSSHSWSIFEHTSFLPHCWCIPHSHLYHHSGPCC